MNGGGSAVPCPAGLLRRLASLAYEFFLVVAILCIPAVLSVFLDFRVPLAKALFQALLLAAPAAYLVTSWMRGGQTVPMRAWKLRLVSREGAALTLGQALARYLLIVAELALAGVGFHLAKPLGPWQPLGFLLGTVGLAWALVDPDRQFLHDRLAGTRIVGVARRIPSAAPPTTSAPASPLETPGSETPR